MGASNGYWKEGKKFDHGETMVITELKDVEPKQIPATAKVILWNSGLVWPTPKDTKRHFWPAVQTVYEDDSSILNTLETICAIATLNKVAGKAFREFTNADMTSAELADAVVEYVKNETDGGAIFANSYNVKPAVFYTAQDEQRGYTWNLDIEIAGNVRKTVMITSISAVRK
jgi:hypothetical protein